MQNKQVYAQNDNDNLQAQNEISSSHQEKIDFLFGAQNLSNISAAHHQQVDPAKMGERERRIRLREQERKNRSAAMHGAGAQENSYGTPLQMPPEMSSGQKLFGSQMPNFSLSGNVVLTDAHASRTNPQNDQTQSYPPHLTSKDQSVELNNIYELPPKASSNNHLMVNPESFGEKQTKSSGHHYAAAQRESPLRQSSSSTAQKLRMAQELDKSINQNVQSVQSQHYQPLPQEQPMTVSSSKATPPHLLQNNQAFQQPLSQNNEHQERVPEFYPPRNPPNNSESVSSSIISGIGNSEIDLKRRQTNRNQQQVEYQRYLASMASKKQLVGGIRQMSAGRQRNLPENGSSLTTAGLNQLHLSPNPTKNSLNNQGGNNFGGRPPLKNPVIDSTEVRRREISDQIFNEVMDSHRNSDFASGPINNQNPSHGLPPHTSSHLPSKSVNLPSIEMQQVGHDLPPRTSIHNPYAMQNQAKQVSYLQNPSQWVAVAPHHPRQLSAMNQSRQEEVRRLQTKQGQDPFFKNRKDEDSERRSEFEKKKAYAAMLQEQMASKVQKQQQLPQSIHHQDLDQNSKQSVAYPNKYVDFGGGVEQFQKRNVGQNQQPSPIKTNLIADQQSNQLLTGQFPSPADESQPYRPAQMTATANTTKQAQQDLYRRQLEEQMRLNLQRKQAVKEDDERYEAAHNQDMAQYMGLIQPRQKSHIHIDPNVESASQVFTQPQTSQSDQQKLSSKHHQQQMDFAGRNNSASPATRSPSSHQNHTNQQPQQHQQSHFDPSTQNMHQNQQNGTGVVVAMDPAIRKGTDITGWSRHNANAEDPAKMDARLKYQTELREQMEEQKRKKEVEKMRSRQQDEDLERKVRGDLARLNQKEISEMKKEGKKVLDAEQTQDIIGQLGQVGGLKAGRAVRRDLFEPSQENQGVFGNLARNPKTDQPEEESHVSHQNSSSTTPIPTTTANTTTVQEQNRQQQELFTARLGGVDQINNKDQSNNFTLQGPMQQAHQAEPTEQQRPNLSQILEGAAGAPQDLAQQNNKGGGGNLGLPQMPSPNNPFSDLNQQQHQLSGTHTSFSLNGGAGGNYNGQQNASQQSEWGGMGMGRNQTEQQMMANKMFEDQQRMIQLYQQALEQIMAYRNQYFEQAMSMRENILKEREQLLEYDKIRRKEQADQHVLKAQQVAEMQQIKAVQNQLQNMMVQAKGTNSSDLTGQQQISRLKDGSQHSQQQLMQANSILNPQVQNNLNQYINSQKEQILQMSQSSEQMAKVLLEQQQHQNHQQVAAQQHIALSNQGQISSSPFRRKEQQKQETTSMIRMSQEKELPVTSTRVEIPRQSHPNPINHLQGINSGFLPTNNKGIVAPENSGQNVHIKDGQSEQQFQETMDLQRQVDELAAQIAASSNEPTPIPSGGQNNGIDFEKSLSSHTKLVKVPLTSSQNKQIQSSQKSTTSNINPSNSAAQQIKNGQGVGINSANANQFELQENTPESNMQRKQAISQTVEGEIPPSNGADLLDTWHENSLQKQLPVSQRTSTLQSSVSPQRVPVSVSEQTSANNQLQNTPATNANGTGVSSGNANNNLSTPKSRIGKLGTLKSPLVASSVPQTIQELPHEDEQQQQQPMNQNQRQIMRSHDRRFNASIANGNKQSEQDFNCRDFSGDEASNHNDVSGHKIQRNSTLMDQQVSQDMEKIERMIQQTQSAAAVDRKATITGSSFYEQTMHAQRIQQQTQQEEMQKQIARIMRSPAQSDTKNLESSLSNGNAQLLKMINDNQQNGRGDEFEEIGLRGVGVGKNLHGNATNQKSGNKDQKSLLYKSSTVKIRASQELLTDNNAPLSSVYNEQQQQEQNQQDQVLSDEIDQQETNLYQKQQNLSVNQATANGFGAGMNNQSVTVNSQGEINIAMMTQNSTQILENQPPAEEIEIPQNSADSQQKEARYNHNGRQMWQLASSSSPPQDGNEEESSPVKSEINTSRFVDEEIQKAHNQPQQPDKNLHDLSSQRVIHDADDGAYEEEEEESVQSKRTFQASILQSQSQNQTLLSEFAQNNLSQQQQMPAGQHIQQRIGTAGQMSELQQQQQVVYEDPDMVPVPMISDPFANDDDQVSFEAHDASEDQSGAHGQNADQTDQIRHQQANISNNTVVDHYSNSHQIHHDHRSSNLIQQNEIVSSGMQRGKVDRGQEEPQKDSHQKQESASYRLYGMTAAAVAADNDPTIAGLARMAPSILKTEDLNVPGGISATSFDHQQQSPLNLEALRQDLNLKMGNLSEQPEEEEQTPAASSNEAKNGNDDTVSKKEKEMMEIAALIAKATHTISETVENEAEYTRKKTQAKEDGAHGGQAGIQDMILAAGKPANPQFQQLSVLKDEKSEQQVNIARRGLGSTTNEEAGTESQKTGEEQMGTNNSDFTKQIKNSNVKDQQILGDLDRIINNLVEQQKNMATFGMPSSPTIHPLSSTTNQENNAEFSDAIQQSQIGEVREIGGSVIQEKNMSQGAKQAEQAIGPTAPTVQRDQNTNWVVPSNSRPISSSGKALPLDPSRPKSGLSKQSRATSASKRCDASPQRVGKYAMMALKQKEERSRIVDTSQNSERAAGAASISQQNTSRVGENSKSPARTLGKYAQMALNASPKPLKDDQLDDIQQRYQRNPSRDRLQKSMISEQKGADVNESQNQADGEISLSNLPVGGVFNNRPISGNSRKSGRYANKSPKVSVLGKFTTQNDNMPLATATTTHQQTSQAAALNSMLIQRPPSGTISQTVDYRGETTAGAVVNSTTSKHQNAPNVKLAAYSDEEDDDLMGQEENFRGQKEAKKVDLASYTGSTNQTSKLQKIMHNINDDE